MPTTRLITMDTKKEELFNLMRAYYPTCSKINNCEVIYYDVNQDTFASCDVNNMKTRWDYLADSGFAIKEIITFYHNHKAYVRMIIDKTSKNFNHVSQVEFALGKFTYGVSYIIPSTVWERRGKEIVTLFN